MNEQFNAKMEPPDYRKLYMYARFERDQLQAELIKLQVSLRDLFAAAALTGLVARERVKDTPEEYAEWSYKFADALLAQRKEKE